MDIKFNDLSSQWKKISKKTLPQIVDVLQTGNFILGKQVTDFEKKFKEWNGNKYAVGVNSGTDALIISVSSLNLKGKTKFYIPANTYIATLLGVVLSNNQNYEYELVDCDEHFQIDCEKLENLIIKDFLSFDNHVVIPVHLYGSCCNMEKLMNLKVDYNLYIIEDCSQSHGTKTSTNQKVGTFGDVSAFSLYPGKNLGASGDAGIIVTDNEEIYKRCVMIRNLGSVEKYKHDVIGRNSRLDTIQSVILSSKLEYIDEWNKKRNKVAKIYNEKIKNTFVTLPQTPNYCGYNTYHIFPILVENRDEFLNYMQLNNIPCLIHYTIPIERTLAFFDENTNNTMTLNFSKKLVSLPIHPFMKNKEINYICNIINNFRNDV
jgi:dTDP-4-amino-4,6-dideoxygalactose transaminase